MEVHYVDCMMAVVKFLFVKKRKTPIDELDSTFTKSMPLAGNVTNAFRDLPSNMDGDKVRERERERNRTSTNRTDRTT